MGTDSPGKLSTPVPRQSGISEPGSQLEPALDSEVTFPKSLPQDTDAQSTDGGVDNDEEVGDSESEVEEETEVKQRVVKSKSQSKKLKGQGSSAPSEAPKPQRPNRRSQVNRALPYYT